jgi:hypothetical protein
MSPALRILSNPCVRSVIAVPHHVFSRRQLLDSRLCTTSATAVRDSNEAASGQKSEKMAPFACLGIDTDLNGAIVIVKCIRNDDMARTGFSEAERSVVRTPRR